MSHPFTPVKQENQQANKHEAHQMVEQLGSFVCSVCNNMRPKYEWKRDFTYAELHAATQGFSPKNFLSEGGFGSVYRGELQGQKIAVKQHMHASYKGEKEFKSEVDALSKARHENVVMLLGSCSEGNHRLLVYEYVCNGSLDQHLSQHSRKPLCWQDRMKIANGAAKGLLYLHENSIIHRDITPNNILLTHDYEVLLGDFGLARIVTEESSCSIDCDGNLAYWAPEYAEFGKVSIKTDVYSFGVVLLQLITGMRTTDRRLGEKGLVGWARSALREGKCQILIDGRMMNSHDCHQLYWMSRLAGNCLKKDPHKRLDISTVVKALNHIVEGCNCCIAGKDHTLAMSGYSKSKDNMLGSSDSEGGESGNIGTSNSAKLKEKAK
ncbi:Tyrosine-protein kinase, active site [Sesbania bispinosa]|nr:Tyrosine-protein kinase, active site [Sesbania bispinosa]